MKVAVAICPKETDYDDQGIVFFPREPLLVDIEVPIQVELALRLVSAIMPRNREVPFIAEYSAHGHGNDFGLVFKKHENEMVSFKKRFELATSFLKWGIVTRISYGPEIFQTASFEMNQRIDVKNPRTLNRLHLSVMGIRQFIGKNTESYDGEGFEYSSERLNFSLRWVDGQFDNGWNDTQVWLDEKDVRYGRNKFHKKRTTHLTSNRGLEKLNGIIRSSEISYDDVERIAGPRKTDAFLNATPREFLANFPEGTKLEDAISAAGFDKSRDYFPINENRSSFPVIGYVPILKLLSQYGDVSEKQASLIQKMNMMEGVEYIFGKVLPAARNYVKS